MLAFAAVVGAAATLTTLYVLLLTLTAGLVLVSSIVFIFNGSSFFKLTKLYISASFGGIGPFGLRALAAAFAASAAAYAALAAASALIQAA